MGLYGEWGSGKTTVLNFIEYYLTNDDENIILHFTPWMFSNVDQLVNIFFDQLIAVLESNFKKYTRESFEKLTTLIVAISDIVSEVPVPGSKLPETLTSYFPSLKSKDLNILKTEVNKLLEKSDKRIVVLLDDLDRLTKAEISQIFKLIKSVADFSNLVYLVSFDKQIVEDALNDDFVDGRRYLEKIIQIPIDVPLINPRHMNTYILDSSITDIRDSDLFDRPEWEKVYRRWISSYFRNFRDVTRFLTRVKFEYSAVRNEVDVIDFLILNILRLFESDIYDLIRRYPYHFISDPLSFISDPTKSLFQDFHTEWLDKYDDREEKERIKYLMLALFPKLHEIHEMPNLFRNFYGSKSGQCRLSNPDYFYLYFRNEPFDNQLRHEDYKNLIAQATNAEELTNLLDDIINDERILDFFDKVRFDETLDESKRIIVMESIFTIGDTVILQSSRGNYSITLIQIIIEFLFTIIDRQYRHSLLENFLRNAKSTSLTLQFLLELQEHALNPFRYEQELFTDEQYLQIKSELNKHMKALITSNEIFEVYDNLYIIRKWFELNKVDNKILFENDVRFVKFLGLFKSQRRILHDDTEYFDFSTLSRFIDPETIAPRVRILLNQNIWSVDEIATLEQFIRDFDAGLHKKV